MVYLRSRCRGRDQQFVAAFWETMDPIGQFGISEFMCTFASEILGYINELQTVLVSRLRRTVMGKRFGQADRQNNRGISLLVSHQ